MSKTNIWSRLGPDGQALPSTTPSAEDSSSAPTVPTVKEGWRVRSTRVLRRIAGNAVRGWAVVWMVSHLTLTVLFNLPMNPIKPQLQPVLNATINAFFPQNWSLFAPNPLTSDTVLLVRPLTAEEVRAFPSRGLPRDGWYDVCMPMWKRFQQNRFTAYDRLVRPFTNVTRAYMGSDLHPWREACKKGDKDSCRFFEEAIKRQQKTMGVTLARTVSAFCMDIARPEEQFTHVAVRVRETKAIPWSKRFTGKPEAKDIELGVFRIEKDVVPMGLYRRQSAPATGSHIAYR